jgi:hypothetical protein
MVVRIEKVICAVLDEAHQRQVEETMETLSEGQVHVDGRRARWWHNCAVSKLAA